MKKNGKGAKRTPLKQEAVKSEKHRRENKNAPMEISSKKRIRKQRENVESREIRDPRFDGLSGKLNYDLFRKSYKFIEEKQDNEIKEMRSRLFKERNENTKRAIQSDMTRIVQQKINRERRDKEVERKHEYMMKERESIKKGKKPFYLKRREKKEAELKDRFESLSKRGKLNKYMEKKRKRNSERDKRNMPLSRSREE